MENAQAAPLLFEDFAGKVGEVFTVAEPDMAAIPLTLTDAERLPTHHAAANARPPFSLVFLGKDSRALPQKLYRLEHAGLGVLTIFLVPVGRDARGVSYQATFN
jgi:hypothetical protein